MSKEVFNRIVNHLHQSGTEIPHQPRCQFGEQGVPVQASPCSCAAYFWFNQGLHATNAECVLKYIEVSQDPNMVEGVYRTKFEDGEWTVWEPVSIPCPPIENTKEE